MSVRVSVGLLVVMALLCAGCRNDPYVQAYIETAGAEKRALEDRVYELEYDLQVAYDELDRVKKTNTDSGSDHPAKKSAPAFTPRSKPSSSKFDLPDLEPPVIDSGSKPSSPKKNLKPELDVPEIEFGEPTKPAPRSATPPALPAPVPEPTANRTPEPEPVSSESKPIAATAEASRRSMAIGTNQDDRITQLYINPFLTGGSDFDNKPGDDGLTVVIEPRNSSNEFVPLAGPVSVVLLDPIQAGEAARVARWDFDAVDASRFLKKSDTSIGLHLQMTWPGPLPENSKLRLYVRFETADQRKLVAEQDVFVTLPGQLSQRWTPKTRKGTTTDLPTMVTSPPIPAPANANNESRESTATLPAPDWKPNR